MKDYKSAHPWRLIGSKIFYFSILNLIFRLPIAYEKKMKFKKKLFFDKFAKFARDEFEVSSKTINCEKYNIYDLGQFAICIEQASEYFPINNLEWNVAYEFLDIIYPSLNPNYFKKILGEGPYEAGNVFCGKGDYVVDAGANMGIFSFLASLKVGDEGHVYAIEPIDFFLRGIKKSIEINSSANISLLENALGKEDKKCVFRLDIENPMNSSKDLKVGQSLTIKQKKLDTLVFEEKKISKVDFIKMDIEGSERDALYGGRETIFK